MGKNLTFRAGNCNHCKYIPLLLDLVRSGVVDPTRVITQHSTVVGAIDAYKPELRAKVKSDIGKDDVKAVGKVCSGGSAELALIAPGVNPGCPGLSESD